ncbi:SRPBCC family protein [Actinospica durhamensis]|uniref:SRPBCC family protein n=1 Tax=Actinospica durhamensis TaxID=1508375 RepID=A0A941EKU1_9ACTN|nr:SRPBCC family protein [Actinospica durhamensis]MBR7832718.1 SRPBCC family protein [Actinospica durhamensis]
MTSHDLTTNPGGARRAVVTTPSDTQILITREFDAPRHLLYRAYTEPELIRRWWHANRGTIESIEVDLRVGGAWRYAMTAAGGFAFSFHGEYREIVPDERLVSTEIYSGAPQAESLSAATFTEKDGRTVLEILVTHRTKEFRDAHLASGMEDGLQDALDLLEGVAQDEPEA